MAAAISMATLGGKVAIVTGASSGIGLAATTALLSNGVKVLGIDISPFTSTISAEHAKITGDHSTSFVFHQCNIVDKTSPDVIVAKCQEAFGPKIDILLNIAGVMDHMGSVDTLDPELWDRVIAVNLTGPVMLMRAVVPIMLKSGGSIVNICSKAGTSGASAGVAYTASKHGLVGATKNVAYRFKDDGVRCNAIAPGAVSTNISNSIDQTKMDMAAYGQMMPVMQVNTGVQMERIEGPEKVVAMLLFLASDMSSGISGAIVPVDNAWSTI